MTRVGNFYVYRNPEHARTDPGRWEFWYRNGPFVIRSQRTYKTREGAVRAIRRFVATVGDATYSWRED